MLAWHLQQFGWDCEILTPSSAFQRQSWVDPEADRFFAPDTLVTEVGPMRFGNMLHRLGIRNVSWQALLPLYNAGNKALGQKHFDLVFFSTTAFNFFCLGRFWRRRFGVPYVLDFQDPWYRPGPSVPTTKHVWKGRVGNLLGSYFEGFAVKKAAGLVSVSPHYLAVLKQRYSEAAAFKKGNAATIPFGARQSDLVASHSGNQPDVPNSSLQIIYVGAGGAIMERGFSRLCRSLIRLRESHRQTVDLFRIRLLGTDSDWVEGKRKTLKYQADTLGLGDLVTEEPTTIPYSQASALAATADGLLVLGVDDPAYMASKLFSYASSGKPLLACIHAESQMNNYFLRYPELGSVIHFGEPEGDEAKEDDTVLDFLDQVIAGHQPERNKLLEEYSADGMTRKLAAVFDRALT
jgi:hypothetical protein